MSGLFRRLKAWKAFGIIAASGLLAFLSGLKNPFQGDDLYQIVKNLPVHSIANINIFFRGGTFYNGQGLSPLIGAYYRPLVTTFFSLLYTFFGPNALYYHLFQLILCIANACILYLLLKYFVKPGLALFFSLLFLLHPLNSQVAFAIPATQDALFFFFGIFALWLLVRFSSIKSLGLVGLSLFFSLLCKETAVVFIILVAVYIFWRKKKQFYPFLGIIVLPITIYVALRINAVGLFTNPSNAPIDHLGLGGRLLTAPSILFFYILSFIFPLKLASGYYWVDKSFGLGRVLIPLIFDLLVIGVFIYIAALIRRDSSKKNFNSYLFFGIWTILGTLTLLQIIPLDMTAAEPWFYLPMVGIIGMLAVFLTAFPLRIKPVFLSIAAVLLLVILGGRTAARGLDWRSQTKLASIDISSSSDNYVDYDILANTSDEKGNYKQAAIYAEQSIAIYPNLGGYASLGLAETNLKNYDSALEAYDHALNYTTDKEAIYQNISNLRANSDNNKSYTLPLNNTEQKQ